MSGENPTCPRCKAKLRAGSKFCSYCLVKLETRVEYEEEGAFLVSSAEEEPPRGDGTGQEDLLAAATQALGGAPQLVMQRGEVLKGYALWKRADQLVLLTLGFSELGRTLDVWPESGRGFELLLRIKGATVPVWLFTALDGLLEHTFKVHVGTPVRLVPTLWCQPFAAAGLEHLSTVNGALRVMELVSPLGPAFGPDDPELTPPLPPDDESRRMEVVWRVEDDEQHREYSVCGTTAVLDGIPERCLSREQAMDRLRSALHEALRTPARVSRSVRARAARRSVVATHSPLEEEFLRARADVTSAQVYRDWLLERGDPRGEVAAWLDSGAHEELSFFWHHDGELLLGEWSGQLPVARFTWTCGFVDGCLVSRSRAARGDFSDQLRAIVELPFLATARGLRLECPERTDLDATWKVIAGAPQAPRLTMLSLNEDGDHASQDFSSTTVGELGSLWSALPALEELRVRASLGNFGKIEHRRLRSLAIESTELSPRRVQELVEANTPSLTSLEVWTGGECGVERLEPLFQRRGLSSFGLVNCDATQDALPILVRSPLFETLKTLSFARGALLDEDVPALVAAASSLRKLERFDVSDNSLTPDALRTLRRAIPTLVSESQREAWEGERYVSVSE